ncbi:MAG: YvrJ family protein [Peptococcaceae bacterium]|nr:YvrJ family protein [Peptococcaceae bacterium]
MNEILSQVGNLGFPIAVSVYLLVRVEKKLDELTIAINALGRILAEL